MTTIFQYKDSNSTVMNLGLAILFSAGAAFYGYQLTKERIQFDVMGFHLTETESLILSIVLFISFLFLCLLCLYALYFNKKNDNTALILTDEYLIIPATVIGTSKKVSISAIENVDTHVQYGEEWLNIITAHKIHYLTERYFETHEQFKLFEYMLSAKIKGEEYNI